MKKIINGEVVEMTQEEYEEWKSEIDDNPIPDTPTAEELLNILTGGDAE